MLEKKRIVRQQPQSERPSVLPKKKVIQEEDVEDMESYEEEEEEVVQPPPKKKLVKAPVAIVREPEPDEDEGEEDEGEEIEESPAPAPKRKVASPAKAKFERDELASAFAQVPLSQSSAIVSEGPHEALITMTLQAKKEGNRGRSVRINARLCEPEFKEFQPLADWRVIITKAGEANPTGIQILVREMAMLGFEPPDLDGGSFTEDLELILQELSDKRPGAKIKVFYQEYQGVDQTRFTIQGKCENDVVSEYRDNIPY